MSIPIPVKYSTPRYLPDGGVAETRKATSNKVASFIFGRKRRNLQFCWRRLTPLLGTPQLDYWLQICDSGYYDIPIPHHWLHQNPQFIVVVRLDEHKMQVRRMADPPFYKLYSNFFTSPWPVSDGSCWRPVRVIRVTVNATVVRRMVC